KFYSQVATSTVQEHNVSSPEPSPNLDLETIQHRDGRQQEAIPVHNENRGQHRQSSITHAEDVDLNVQAPDANRVKDDKIFQSFELLESSDNITSAHATVDILTPNVTCEAARVKSAHQNMTDYFVPETLKNSATSVFQGLVLQVAQDELLQPAKIDSTGFVTLSIDRLQIRKAPLIVMIVSFALLTCLALVIMLVVRRRVVPQMPGSIASYASILARSSTLQPLLENTGRMRTTELTRKLDGLQFQVIHSDHAFEIEASSGNQELVRTTKPKIKHAQWMPWAARIPLLTLVFALALLVITILEVLQQVSNRNNGVAELHNGDSDAISYVIRYGTNLAALLMATMFNNLDFTIATLTPFHALRSGKASARESISLSVVGHIPLVALFACLRYKHFGTALSIFAAFVGSFLTIISSGLWVADNQVLDSINVKNYLGSSWDLTWSNNSADDAGASKLMNALDFGGSPEPVGTWTSFALPTLGKATTNRENGEALEPANTADNSLRRYIFDIDGLRPELNCTVCPKEDFRYDETSTSASIITDGVESPIMSKSLEAYFRLPVNCRNTDSKNSSFVSLNYTFAKDGNGEPSLIGNFYELNVSSARIDPASPAKQIQGSEGCPSLGILFGHFENITAVLCSQRIRSVPMTITYSGDPAASILDARHPPVVSDNGPPKYMIDADGLSYYPATAQDHATAGQLKDIEPVFDHLLYGPSNALEADLLGIDHAQDFINAINRVYNKYMVQVLNIVLRSPPKENPTIKKVADAGEEETAAVTVGGRLIRQITRLKMNNASKSTFQIMLAVMVVLSGIAVRLVKIRGTLPRDPYSMASVMGFLAGSKMSNPESKIIPPGSEFLGLDGLAKVFDGQKFRLGWWPASPDTGGSSGRKTGRSASQQQRDAYAENRSSNNKWDGSPAEESSEMLLEKQNAAVLSKDRSRFGIDIHSVGSAHASIEDVSQTVYGWSFGKFMVDDITEIVWNPCSFENLAIPATKKKVITALAKAHMSRAADDLTDDFMEGKEGPSGPPGVHKTLTVEGLLKYFRRPLYAVHLASSFTWSF
ncbi:MAG: hypothetical protein Q9216_004513, partial [Gyalolechia sp. 2 TL-2023]